MQNEIELQQYNADKARQNKPAAASREIPASYEEFRDFIRERSRTVAKMPMSVIQNASTMNTQDNADYVAKQKQKKSTFEQIYESAMERLNLNEQEKPRDLINTPALVPLKPIGSRERAQWQKPEFGAG